MFAWPPYSDMVEVGVLNGFFRKGGELIWFYAQSGSYKPLSCRDLYKKGRACRFCDCFCRFPRIRGNKRQGVYSLLVGFIFSSSTIWNSNLMFLNSFSWIIGGIIALIVYYLLAREY